MNPLTGSLRYQMLDLASDFALSREQTAAAILKTMQEGNFVLGPEVAAFERAFAGFIGAEAVIGVGSGTDALVMSLLAAGIGSGQGVITTPFTFVATAEAILRVGARPTLVDINPKTLNLDPGAASNSCNGDTAAVLTVHLFGNPSGLIEIETLCDRLGLALIEDAAHGLGASSNHRAVGTIGQFGAFSYHPTKTLGAAGDGGAVACSASSARIIRELRNHGSIDKVRFIRRGFNSRLDEIQAAILNVKLSSLTARVQARQRNAATYIQQLEGLPIDLPVVTDESSVHGYNYFTIQSASRDALSAHLASRKIASAVYYRTPIHLMEAYSDLGYARGDFPVAERAALRCLSLPCHPTLSTSDIEYIASEVRRFHQC